MSAVPSRAEPSEGSTEAVRREKLERLRAEGVEPYPRAGFPDRDKISAMTSALTGALAWKTADSRLHNSQ